MTSFDHNWITACRVYLNPRVLSMLFLGFSSGLPFGILAEPLTAWLFDSGVTKTSIGLFALVSLPYSLKFLWAPLIDSTNIPMITSWFGRRRGWALVTQLALLIAIIGLAFADPLQNLFMVAIFALGVAFASASQDVVLDAYRIEILETKSLAAGAAMLVFGWRFGQVGGAAAGLILADIFSWPLVFLGMASLTIIGMITVIINPEPKNNSIHQGPELRAGLMRNHPESASFSNIYFKFVAWIYNALVSPFVDFISRNGWFAVLAFIMLYKLGDAILAVMKVPFFLELGFTKTEIAGVAKLFGFNAIILGGIFGGIILAKIGILRGLFVCGILMASSNLIFIVQAFVGHDLSCLAFTIAIENITTGMGTTAFVAYLSSLCNMAYTATQYALLTSLMAFSRTIVSSGAGWFAEQLDWVPFFILTTLIAIPALIILKYISTNLAERSPP